MFYPKIQDSRQKWQENDFWGKSPDDFEDTLGIKNFIQIALSHTVSQINVFFCFLRRNSEWPNKNGAKTIFWECHQMTADRYPGDQKFCVNYYLSPFQDKCVFAFHAEI